MQSNLLSASIPMHCKPQSGEKAYQLVLQALTREIQEKQSMLTELQTDSIRQRFIRGWTPQTATVNIHL